MLLLLNKEEIYRSMSIIDMGGVYQGLGGQAPHEAAYFQAFLNGGYCSMVNEHLTIKAMPKCKKTEQIFVVSTSEY